MEQGLLIDHQKTDCVHRPIACSFCGENQRFINLESHEQRCGDELEKCSECGKDVRKRDMPDHPYECRVKCKCGKVVPRLDLPVHLANECELRMIRCIYCKLQFPVRAHRIIAPHQ